MRDIKQLHPKLQSKIRTFLEKCENAGLKVGISECLRTTAEQDALYAQGRTKPGKIVTNAKGSNYGSMHQWGVAFDFYRNDGKGSYNTSGKFFEKVGSIGKSVGLEWGGDWKSIKDMPHFQLPDWGSTPSRLKALYNKPELFFKSWGVVEPTKPTTYPKYKVTATTLRLRNKPFLTSSVIAKMPKEAIFVSTGETKNGFIKGTYGKKMGWASSKYLKGV